jgi:hypothetical protein
MKKLIYTSDETFEASAEVANFGENPLVSCTPEWRLTTKNGTPVKKGKLSKSNIALGNCIQLGKISVPLSTLTSPQKLTLEISVGSFSNSWDIWVYPSKKEDVAATDQMRIVSTLDAATKDFLEKGGSVLLTLKKGTLNPQFGGKIAIGFSSIFWNTAWTRGQAPHTLGILCNPNHPALAGFPTEYHSNWQWQDAMSHSGAIDLTNFPVGLKPILRVIDDWFTNRPLALLFEARVGKGKILVSGIDLTSDLCQRPEARQLLYSLKKYMAGNQFNPISIIQTGIIQKLAD